MEKEFLNLTEAAIFLGMKRTSAKAWPSWIRWGVNPSRFPNGRKLYFRKTELLKMMEKLKVQKGESNVIAS